MVTFTCDKCKRNVKSENDLSRIDDSFEVCKKCKQDLIIVIKKWIGQ